MHDYVTWLRDSSPYINSHRDRTFVVMLPGDGVEHANFANIVHDLVLLHSLGVRLVLVFGSRPQIEARLAARGITPRFHRDLRITDGPTMECVIDAVGQLRIALEARLSMDKAASPMQGARLPVASGNFVTARPIGVLDGVDLHHTGEVRRIDRKGIGRLLDERTIVPAGVYDDAREMLARRGLTLSVVADENRLDATTQRILLDNPLAYAVDRDGRIAATRGGLLGVFVLEGLAHAAKGGAPAETAVSR